VACGELVDHTPVEDLAAAISTRLMGLYALSRAQVDPDVLRRASDRQIEALRAFERPSGSVQSRCPPPAG